VLDTGGVVASHNGDSALLFRSGTQFLVSDMQRTRKYGPLIALVSGLVLTAIWAVVIAWLPLQVIASVILQMVAQIAS
jgi:hypothetical protein